MHGGYGRGGVEEVWPEEADDWPHGSDTADAAAWEQPPWAAPPAPPEDPDALLSAARANLASNALLAAARDGEKALALFHALADPRGEEHARLLLSEVYCLRGRPDLAPHRTEALRIAEDMGEALARRDAASFWFAQEQLASLGLSRPLVTAAELASMWGPALQEDPDGALEFIRLNALEVGGEALDLRRFGASGALAGDCCRQFRKEQLYLSFRMAGICYGPRYRCVEVASARTASRQGDSEEAAGFAVLKLAEEAEDWEGGLKNSPSILDAMLQATSVVGRG